MKNQIIIKTGGGNKPEPWNPQQPPENSSWKIVNGTFNDEFNTRNNKWYIMSARKPKTTDDWRMIKFKNNDIDKPFGNVWNNSVALDSEWYSVAELYRWDGLLEPITLPLIDIKTGKIIDLNEQKD
ncbi:hypothetical protein [Spiroplasma melliferum]|uniref:Spiroplasmavirus-related protein n=1 Tax=Spiroplasma melliferum TaxID=2134 RepID=A0ABX5U7Z2_SPIME|nr:hypothetical protein [Spiroplasma melliferum]QCO23423.1 hypothetical protein SRED_001892 [Spiroplasma melliferum]